MIHGLQFILILVFLSCNTIDIKDVKTSDREKNYILPFPKGKKYLCSQGFNTDFSHQGTFIYSVDFEMDIGTLITAARGGKVVKIIERYQDFNYGRGEVNVVIIRHEDDTFGRYCHLTQNGSLVKLEQMVQAGDSIAYSGQTGYTNHPHLHFDVTEEQTGEFDQTIPFYFKDIPEEDGELREGRWYTRK